jgi:hypothetical protein
MTSFLNGSKPTQALVNTATPYVKGLLDKVHSEMEAGLEIADGLNTIRNDPARVEALTILLIDALYTLVDKNYQMFAKAEARKKIYITGLKKDLTSRKIDLQMEKNFGAT